MSAILETTVERWVKVREENENDKHLVRKEDRDRWEEFEKETSVRLKEIIEKYNGEGLPDSDMDWLRDINNLIDRAKRVSREELTEQKRAEEEAEKKRAEEEARKLEAEEKKKHQLETTKKSLLQRLGF